MNTVATQVQAIRCSDTNGTVSDNGNYVHLIIDFTSIIVPNTSLYVPKIYLDNDQQEPVVDWKLTNNNTHTTTTINNSTSVSAERILAGNLITNGTFDTYLNIEDADEDAVFNYKVYTPSSASGVYQRDASTSTISTITKYWNGTPGSAIFTSSTYIFDAIPNGKGITFGGPATQEGFICKMLAEFEQGAKGIVKLIKW